MFSLSIGYKELYKHTRLLSIPEAIDDYNHYIDRVDITDQLQVFSTQQRGVKPWKPLFYWLLDSTIINAFWLSEHQRKTQLSRRDKVQSIHQTFCKALVSELLKDLFPKAPRQTYVTTNTALSNIQLTRPIEIHRQISEKQAPCVFCRWSRVTKKGRTTKVIAKSANVYKTTLVCSHCSINLCRECFNVFHYYID
jgi:hypothetical protein